MSKFKNLSGKDLVRIFSVFDFVVLSQNGSHIKLRKVSISGDKETLIIPNHKSIDKGLLKGIFRQAAIYLPEDKIRDHFYTE